MSAMALLRITRLLFLVAACGMSCCASQEPGASGLKAKWLGQDGHDYCQTASTLGPNDIQDLHIRLEGLPANKEIEAALIQRLGGGAWAVGGQWRHWAGKLVRTPNAPTADLFLEPSHDEASCRLNIELHFNDGTVGRVSLAGGRSDPNLFMPGSCLTATWVGQEHQDWTGPSAAVGPDGLEDAKIHVTGLSTHLEIKSLRLEGPGNGWEYGLNPTRRANAELLRDPRQPSEGDLFFSPDRNLEGQNLLLTVTYKNERATGTILKAGKTGLRQPMPKPLAIPINFKRLSIGWLGQVGSQGDHAGEVRISARCVPPERKVLAAALSDSAGCYWIYRRDAEVDFYPRAGAQEPPSLPLALAQAPEVDALIFSFPPARDEQGTPIVLRLLLDDHSTLVGRLVGQRCDVSLRGDQPPAAAIEAHPGDDLNRLARQYGHVHLAPGQFLLREPMKLPRPVRISGSKDTVLRFTQARTEPPWSGAVLIGASRVTLEGFSIRFSDAFRWDIGGPQGAALIRTFDPPGTRDPKINITLEDLDIASSLPPSNADPAHPLEAPFIARLAGATSGKVLRNKFRGGTVDVANGPWLIADNEYCGTPAGTVAWDAFAGHWLHDLILERNRVRAVSPAGKIWRFLSMNQLGQNVIVRSNEVSGVGMRDDDTMANPNAPEILLTESYRLYYEGVPAAISQDGFVLQVPMVMYSRVRPGAVVSVLEGNHQGEFFRIAQPLTPTAFLMADPLPPGEYAISVAHGFLDGRIEGNTIDIRGGKSAALVLAGNHWGFQVLNNHLLGGGDSLIIQATPTEQPFIWGWSHDPFFGFLCEGNRSEDSLRGFSIDVPENEFTKRFVGRTYLSGTLRHNVISLRATPGALETAALRLGLHSARESEQMVLAVEGNRGAVTGGKSPGADLTVQAATINGVRAEDEVIRLPPLE